MNKYYFHLSKNADFAASPINIILMKVIAADAVNLTSYVIDYIKTFK